MLHGWGASWTSSSSNRSAPPESTLAVRTASTTRSPSWGPCFDNPSNGARVRRDPSRASGSWTYLGDLPANAPPPHPPPPGGGGAPLGWGGTPFFGGAGS